METIINIGCISMQFFLKETSGIKKFFIEFSFIQNAGFY